MKFMWPVASLTVISAACAAALAYVNALTADPIKEASAAKEKAAVLAAMPEGVVRVEPAGDGDVYAGMSADGKTLGYAAKGTDAGGYGGDITLMVGFAADGETVVGYKTLAAAETPGLGMKLSTPEFSGQFAGRNGSSLKVSKDGGEIEAITSATITSRAVCRAVADAAARVAAARRARTPGK